MSANGTRTFPRHFSPDDGKTCHLELQVDAFVIGVWRENRNIYVREWGGEISGEIAPEYNTEARRGHSPVTLPTEHCLHRHNNNDLSLFTTTINHMICRSTPWTDYKSPFVLLEIRNLIVVVVTQMTSLWGKITPDIKVHHKKIHFFTLWSFS